MTAHLIRPVQALSRFASRTNRLCVFSALARPAQPSSTRCTTGTSPSPSPSGSSSPNNHSRHGLHTTASAGRMARDNKEYERHASEMGSLDVLGSLPVPESSVTTCTARGFKLHGGAVTDNGDALMMFDDHVVRWRPWEHEKMGGRMRILNDKGQLDLPAEVFGVFDVMWPRPDMIIIGSGPSIAPMSPAMRNVFVQLGMRVDVLDTRNAAAQYNLLATERGTDTIAAALFPLGWKDGVGAAGA
ncbi:hypothetical protein BROUX41_005106 [Berkeleyomyces rouxiae]|uniref:uncharacterized protein n=1 Tax=Berkeleyomyces rouxiae TaxID=2035830 RepID=UPI003B790626